MTYRAEPRPEGARAKLGWSVVTIIWLTGTGFRYAPGVTIALFLAFVVVSTVVAVGNGPGSPRDRR